MNFLFFLVSAFSYSQTATYPPEPGRYETYQTKEEQTISIGDKVEIGIPYGGKEFIFISQGNEYVKSRLAGDIVEIIKLEALSNNKTSYKMQAYFKGYGLLPVVIDLENALKVKEIILLNQ
ncbi:hypothetical protein [Bizionia arctica]|nr:hypothetical protein [Bizionia arctica]